ncbi:MAG: T9SS type A sorting domain-containing protein [Bacteroidota bacterium]
MFYNRGRYYSLDNEDNTEVFEFLSWVSTSLLAILPGSLYFDIQAEDLFNGVVTLPVSLTVNDGSMAVTDLPEASISIYPNPATDHLFVESSLNMDHAVILLVDIQGQVVRSSELKEFNKIKIEGLGEGIYMVRIQNDMVMINKKIVIR